MKVQLFGQGRGVTDHPPFRSRDRSAGDRARDERNWPRAVDAYRHHLDHRPDDSAIWVQFGHVQKECGDIAAAERAYRRATELEPGQPGAHLHLGHVLKAAGRPEQAARAFMKVLALEDSADAVQELRRLGYERDADALMCRWNKARTKRYIEIGDLLNLLPGLTTPTGIQRVQIGLLGHIFDGMEDEESRRYEFVWRAPGGLHLMTADRAAVALLFRLTRSFPLDAEAVRATVERCRGGYRAASLREGDVYFVPGAFWTDINPALLPSLKAQGVVVGAYFYDLIPLTHAQFCDAPFAEQFAVAFAECAPFLDFALTISEYVAREVAAFVEAHGLPRFPVLAAPLAHRLGEDAVATPPGPAVRRFRPGSFALCVGTIEARKNHIYLFYLWRQLLREGVDVPDLVLVGRRGWLVGDLFSQLQASNHLDGRVHVLHDVSDADLGHLYAGCQFTIFPSFVEGWGLPVGESLARGRVTVASSEGSVPEVGGDCAVYIDPFNLHSGVTAVRRLVTDAAWRAELEADIAARFVPRGWPDAAATFFRRMEQAVAELAPTTAPAPPHLAPDVLLEVARLQRPPAPVSAYVRNPQRLMFAEGWRQIDGGGAWIEERAATLRFRSDLPPGTGVMLYVVMAVVPWVQDNHLTIAVQGSGMTGGARVRRPLNPGQQFVQTLEASVEADGTITVEFLIDGVVRANLPDEPRVLCARLVALGHAAAGDAAARVGLLEQIVCR